ncbi:MAG: hypothetical protein ACREHG_05275 [Candidatus Saccharimonadales bacterium]
MTATNHCLTGAAIGLIVGQPVIAVPVALASHFVCDSLPHFGAGEQALKTLAFRYYLIAEAVLCATIVLTLAVIHPQNWLLASVCGFVATSPDFLSINRYMRVNSGKKWRPNLYSRFAKGIQWFERPIGAVVEVAWAAGAIAMILPFLLVKG